MNIAILTGDLSNEYAGTVATGLLEEGHRVSGIVISRPRRRQRLRLLLARQGLGALVGRVRQPAESRSAGRSNGDVPIGPSLGSVARERGLPHLFVRSVNEKDALAWLRARDPDVLIYAGGGILKEPIISVPRIGVLNAHMGRLPDYRGMNALEWSLLYGDRLGVTIHFIDAGVDTGDVLLFRELVPESGDTIASLRRKAAQVSAVAMLDCVRDLAAGTARREPQTGQGTLRQYFVMHSRLKQVAEGRLQSVARPAS